MTAPLVVPQKPMTTVPAPKKPGRLWRRPDRASIATRSMLVGSIAVGLLAASILDIGVVGAAYLIVGIGVLAVVGILTPPRLTPVQWAACVGALALLGVAAVRGAGWLAFMCIVAAWVVFTGVLVGGRTWTGIVAGTVMPWRAAFRVLRFARRRNPRAGNTPRIPTLRLVAVSAVSITLLLIFGSLFVSADPEFAKIFGGAPSVRVDEPIGRLVIGALVAFVTLSAVYLRRRTPRVDALAPKPSVPLPLWEWAVPLAVLNILFLGFVAVQLKTLFGGDEHVQVTDGLTYANYARQGFWQLMAVTVLTLVVIAVAVRRVDRGDRRSRNLAQGLLGALCAFSLVIVASAVHRMWLYENQYGFTRLRVSVFAAELLLGVVFILLIAAGVRMSGKWLPIGVLTTAVVGLLAFAVFNPDAYIAEKNVQRFEDGKSIDTLYLSTLSADAVPALDRLPEPQRTQTLHFLQQELLGSEDSWWEFNSSRERAREILAG
ncbi:DUF4153 domain-containing protein [Rhodococcus sp. ARC_M6]|uniref:DUF4153 domain-containing protein n=1 Tax=Rhodococcus sp. ARC_M6 TaxID=2928852 RepID=UPI001FB450B7|nr:DUF4173 domain-containing protein [Rhodococcus sp. ARC_M6]MCJ0905282.1 DUF4173 domain-containing protein [Rhodococcus sp. ARC_M6]